LRIKITAYFLTIQNEMLRPCETKVSKSAHGGVKRERWWER